MKLVISGLPGCGSSTLAILASYVFNLRLVKGSASFRYFASKLGAKTNNEETLLIEKEIQPYWGPIYDKFIQQILNSDTNLMFTNICVDSDLAGFFCNKKPNLVRVFLYADIESRVSRFTNDDREAKKEEILEIDQKLQREYQTLYGFDFLDLAFVRGKYEIVIDNSNMSLASEINSIQNYVRNNINNNFQTISIEELDNIEKDFWLYGKSHFIRLLENKNLVANGLDVIKLVKKLLPSEITNLPHYLRDLVENLQ